jgi:alkylation response protein AidB-like acyl-CoA dehydrogenase
MVDMSVSYTADRQQFGKPVGSFQAVKHHMANVAVKLEYARAPVHRAAYALANGDACAPRAVSHAKLAACEAANLAAKNAIQVHGAMGYTWEVDLHIFMKKAWALANTWGDAGYHKRRVADYIFSDTAQLGAIGTFH